MRALLRYVTFLCLPVVAGVLTCIVGAAPPSKSQSTVDRDSIAYAPGDQVPSDQPVEKPAPMRQPAANPCLSEPQHFTSLPTLTAGTELILSRYLRFVTPDGRAVFARMFLLEIHPERAQFPDNVSEEVKQKRRRVPQRMVAIGHEIAVDDPLKFQPDFDVPAEYVKASGRCAYDVDLGSVKCRVRTAD